MNLIIQVLLINLVISCENVGVFALASNGLQPGMAKKVHRIGVGLSLVFKLIFIAIASILFAIPWLHIRIIGGVLLLYITFNMLFHSKQTSDRELQSKNNGNRKVILRSSKISLHLFARCQRCKHFTLFYIGTTIYHTLAPWSKLIQLFVCHVGTWAVIKQIV